MKFGSISFLLITLFLIVSCKATDSGTELDPQTLQNNEFIYDLMKTWYLWNDEIDTNLSPADFSSPQELLDNQRNSQFDRWSSVSDANRFTTYYDEGTYLGYGFSYDWDYENNIRFRYIYNDSPFGEAGIQRGWKLLAIDGVDVSAITDFSNAFGESEVGFTQTFLLEDLAGNRQEFSIAKRIVTINPVLYADTLSIGTEKVGYLAFNNFINPAKNELDEAFNTFESANIDRLILDLRYNGGGLLHIAYYLATYLIKQENNGEILYQVRHNEDLSSNRDGGPKLNKKGLLNLDELIILSTDGTASASELIINGLDPILDVTHIGDGNTYGKPVGSYTWFNSDETEAYTIISFRFVNKNEEGNFFDGIEPDFTACDEINLPLGNVNESMLKSAIEYITTGQTSGCDLLPKSHFRGPELPQEEPGPSLIINSWN